MRVLLLTQWFDPEPALKGLPFAQKLRERGYQVEVLTGFPNYPQGKLYPGYRLRLWQRESLDGVPVVRVPLYPSHDTSTLRRACNYLSFAVAATLLGPFLLRRPDVIYAYHPPGTVGLPALALARWFGAPLIYDVQDLWPDTIAATGMAPGGPAMRLLGWFCRLVYRGADRVAVLSPGFRETLIRRGVDADRVRVIYNWAPALVVSPVESSAAGPFTVVFAGNLGLAQGLDAVLDAARICASTVPEAQFLFVGGGVDADRLKERAGGMGLANVRFLEWQPQVAIQKLFAGAGALLVHLKDDPLFAITIPSKTQAFLAAGRPIVMAVRGDAAELVARAGAGVLAEPGDPQSIAAAVERLARLSPGERERMGRAGRAFYEKELAIDRAVERFDALFREVARDNRSRIFDLAAAVGAILLLWPVMLCVALAVRWKLGSPVLFRQVRTGKAGRPFELIKFRTMRETRSADGQLLSDEQRLTGVGRFLRSASLDELPELWNVLRGEMNLVGPRPLLPQYLARYTARQARRHEVLPGITGWAQTHGRNAIGWPEKLELDVWYVEHRSFLLDLKILLITAFCVVQRRGIGAEGCATMPEFQGTESTSACL